jgi:hypothetical protein
VREREITTKSLLAEDELSGIKHAEDTQKLKIKILL